MLVALAAVWFIVFLPSLGKRNRDKDDVSRERRERREQLSVNASAETSGLVSKAKKAQRVFLVLAAISVIATIVSVFQGSTLGAGVGAAVAAGFVLLSRIASARASKAIGSASARRNKIPTGIVGSKIEFEEEQELFDDRSWAPTELPEQAYRSRIGTLENPTLADVVQIEFPGELDSKTLDEILRRRRAN